SFQAPSRLAALAHDAQGAMAAVEVQVVDVGAERFADAQPVHGQERDQRVIAWASRGRPAPARRRARCGPSPASGTGTLVMWSRDVRRSAGTRDAPFGGFAADRWGSPGVGRWWGGGGSSHKPRCAVIRPSF